jgi:DNA-binding PadR family transcriptional regulator
MAKSRAAPPAERKPRTELTSRESMVLAMVQRNQPVTAYRIRRIFADSIVTNYTNSTGTIYPIIRRLVRRGYVAAQVVEDSKRGAELLRCTEAGVEAIREWIQRIDGEDLVLADPLRSKLSHMAVLKPSERIRWLNALRAALTASLDDLEEFGRKNQDIAFYVLVQDNARSTLVGRLEWVNRTLSRLELESRFAGTAAEE